MSRCVGVKNWAEKRKPAGADKSENLCTHRVPNFPDITTWHPIIKGAIRPWSGQLKCKFGASADLLMRRRKPLRISWEPLLQVGKKLCVSVGIPWQLNWEWRSANAIRVPANIWILQLLTAIDQNHCNWNKIKELRDSGATAIYDQNWQKHASMSLSWSEWLYLGMVFTNLLMMIPFSRWSLFGNESSINVNQNQSIRKTIYTGINDQNIKKLQMDSSTQ